MPFEVGKDAKFGGVHASNNAEIDVPSSSDPGKKEVKLNNDMDIKGSLKVEGVHANSNAIVRRKGAQQDVELSATDADVKVQEELNVGGLHASGNAKVKDSSPNYKLVFGCLVVAAAVAVVLYKKKIIK